MAELDWERMARVRLERSVAGVVDRLRKLADQVEAEAAHNMRGVGDSDYATYNRVGSQVVHAVTWGVANTNLSTLLDAAADAEAARTQAQS